MVPEMITKQEFYLFTPNFKMVHQKCRGENYSTTEVKRFQFPDDLIYYEVDYPEYQPTDFTGKYHF